MVRRRTVDVEAVRAVLARVVDPELSADIVTLGMVGNITADPQGVVTIPIALTTSGCPLRAQLRDDAVRLVNSIPGVSHVKVTFSEMSAAQRSLVMDRARANAQLRAPDSSIPSTCRVVAFASGKGGVGKSSVAATVAWRLAEQGFVVGLLDADIWGFSVPRLLGISDRLQARPNPDRDIDDPSLHGSGIIVPAVSPVGEGVLHVVSSGLLLDDPEVALMWRGMVLSRALQHFVEDVDWAGLDYLIVDMPPGTGDVQMALARLLPRTDVVVVTTPSPNATQVASRVADMAQRSNLRLAGLVENMAGAVCPHGSRLDLLGPPRGPDVAARLGVPLLASIPMSPRFAAAEEASVPALRVEVGFDDGVPGAYETLTRALVEQVAPPVDVASCTSRILRRLAALEG